MSPCSQANMPHLPPGLAVLRPPVSSGPNVYILGEELMNFIKTDFTHVDIEKSPWKVKNRKNGFNIFFSCLKDEVRQASTL